MKRQFFTYGKIFTLATIVILSVTTLSACFYSYMPCPRRYFDTYEELQQTHPEFYYFDNFSNEFEYGGDNFFFYDGEIRTDNNGAEIDYSRFNPLGYAIFFMPIQHSESVELVELYVLSMTNPRQPNTGVTDFDTNLTVDNIDCRFGKNMTAHEETDYSYYLALTFELENVNYAFLLIESYNPEKFDPTDPTIEEPFIQNFIDLVTHAIINRHKGGETNVL